MTSQEHKRCDLCAGRFFELIGAYDRNGRPLRTTVCRQCGLVSHEQIPTKQELAEFYSHQYRQAYHGETTPSARRVMRAWKKARRIYEQLQPYLHPTSCILEIGAGIGCTVKYFDQKGYDSSGIEPHAGFCTYGRQRLRARLQPGFIEDLHQPADNDMVLLIHIIEHLSTPSEAFRRIRTVLRGGGRLYVECPNVVAPFTHRRRLFHYAHIHNFSPRTLRQIAAHAGFEVERHFSKKADPVVRMLFRATGKCDTSIDPAGYRETMAALQRYNLLTYHLRWSYLRGRARKLASYLVEQRTAKSYVRRLLHDCSPSKGTGIQCIERG